MNKDEILDNLINPSFDASTLDWDTCVTLASDAVEGQERYQKVLGKLALAQGRKRGGNILGKFAQAIEDHTGRKVSPRSLGVYRYVYQVLEPVMGRIPEDWSYNVWKHLATLGETLEPTLTQALNDGLSGPELIRQINISKGRHENKIMICNRCRTMNLDSKVCLVCGNPVDF